MLTDDQLIDQIHTELHAELAVLEPPADLLERLTDGPVRVHGARAKFGRGRRARGSRVFAGAGMRAAPVALALLLTIGVAAVAITALRHAPTKSAASARIPGRQRLIDIIGELRRPQTHADLNPVLVSRFARPVNQQAGPPDVALMRYATTTSWGQKLYLVPFKPPTPDRVRCSRGVTPPAATQVCVLGETLALATPHSSLSLVALPEDAAQIEAGALAAGEAAGHPVLGGGRSAVRFVYVVPDGVARVQFVLPRDPLPGVPFEAVYSHSLSVTVPVHNNIAAVQIDRQFDTSHPPMIWYATNGSVIKRIGNFANINRVVPEPQPGPQTALSRAAQRNPATPNPIWVTPSVGGPHTTFTRHFKQVLNEASYSYRLTGPHCRTISFLGGDSGGDYAHQNAIETELRGRIANQPLANQGSTWCPGTYHLTASVVSLGAFGNDTHSWKPFGTTTFTVHP